MNGSGWNVDTGHKSGYLNFIEKEMAKKIPNCDLKADPHIKSKVKILKKQLSNILDIQQHGNGFGWDDEKKMVVGDKDVFMEWAKSRDEASALYGKCFLHFDKLVEIYAHDLARRLKVKGPGDEIGTNEEHSTCKPNVASEQVDEDASQTPISGDLKTTLVFLGILTKESLELDSLEVEFIQISKPMSDIKKAFTHEVDVHEKNCESRKKLFQVLCSLPGLTPEQVVKAT